jgi:hypothetical protein
MNPHVTGKRFVILLYINNSVSDSTLQQTIYDKFTSIGFNNAKVFVSSVDAQSSANGGILIQVIGEMAHDGSGFQKFAQTFFLAEQPNGYFVLNDIFRFLKEEVVADDEPIKPDGVIPDSQPAPDPERSAESPAPPEEEPESVNIPAAVPPPPAPQVVDEPPVVAVPEPAEPSRSPSPEPHVNGIHTEEPEPTPEPPAPVEKPAPPPAPSPAPAPQPPVVNQAPPPSYEAQAPPPPAPKPAAPPAPRTWANLAAQDPKRWGPAVNLESRGTTEVPVAASSPAPPTGTQTPPNQHGPPHGRGPTGHREHPAIIAAHNLTTAQVFVKVCIFLHSGIILYSQSLQGVTEVVSNTTLSQVLTSRFGPIKDLEIVRSKACAFLEFLSLDAAKKAIITSLPPGQGGEGGIRIDIPGAGGEGGGQVRLSVETKKERGDRPAPRPRGGAPPVNGERGGGNFRGRGGADRARGRGSAVGGK